MSHHFGRLCLCKEGWCYSCTTSYLIKTFSNLTVSCASDLRFFFLWTKEWQPDFHLISWFSFCFEWVCHDQELLNLSIAIAHTEAFLTNAIKSHCQIIPSDTSCHLQLESEAGEFLLALGAPSPVNVTATYHALFFKNHFTTTYCFLLLLTSRSAHPPSYGQVMGTLLLVCLLPLDPAKRLFQLLTPKFENMKAPLLLAPGNLTFQPTTPFIDTFLSVFFHCTINTAAVARNCFQQHPTTCWLDQSPFGSGSLGWF